MKIVVFSPVCAKVNPYVQDAYKSLVGQTFGSWEWVIGLNNGGSVPEEVSADPRVTVFEIADDTGDVVHNRIGRLKRECTARARGDILLELDADDMLTPDALEKVAEAFCDPAVCFVYSNTSEFKHGTFEPHVYSEHWGWRSRDFAWEGHALKEMIAWEPSPHMMRLVFWAPNHLRAWRSSDYWNLGGHSPEMVTGDDHDLLCRTYLYGGAGRMRHIDECLYLYRVHGENSCVTNNAGVQEATWKSYVKYFAGMCERWARDCGLRLVDLGGRMACPGGYESVDLYGADITADLNLSWPLPDDSIGVLRASHVLEHLKDPIHVMNEAYRVLAPAGVFLIDVPSTDGRGAFQDPTHVSYWNSNSFWYFTQSKYAAYVPAFKGRFQASLVADFFPDDHSRAHNIVVTRADLIALKPPYSDRPVGEALI